MTKSRTYQSAQIGVIAVLLTTVLLAIGISISTRVVEQTQQELSRQESAQQFQQAESGADMGSQMTDPGESAGIDGTFVSNPDVSGTGAPANQTDREQTYSSDIDTVYLLQGDTVELTYDATNLSSSHIAWELTEGGTTSLNCNERPSLLITIINGGNKAIFPFRPSIGGSCTPDLSIAGYFKSSGNAPYTDSIYNYTKYSSFIGDESYNNISLGDLVSDSQYADFGTCAGCQVRIEALYAPTYVYLPGLTSTTRSVSSNQVGNESRVVEQNTTNLAPSYVTDFTIFAGNSRICQGDSNGCN